MRFLLFTLLSILSSTTYSYAIAPIPGFVFTVNTANISSGSSNSTSFTIPTIGSGYNYSVDWTDSGTPTTTGQTGNATHDFGTAGTYTIRITGTFPRIYFAGSADSLKMISIVQWGYNTNWTSFANAFYGCSNMKITANDAPTLTGVTSFNQMFYNCPSITTGHFSNWYVQTITDMSRMFYNCSQFNDNIGSWNTSAVTNMNAMFQGASAFNQNIGSWNTAKVTNMSFMFCNASLFNNLGSSFTSNWNTAAVNNMTAMFYGANAFNQNIGGWNTSAVYNMANMFYAATAFNQNLGGWNIANLSSIDSSNTTHGMFSYCGISPSNYDLSLAGWSTTSTRSYINLTASGIKYCSSSSSRRSSLGWTITGDGYLYASTAPTLVAANALMATSNATCTDATGYQQFLNNLSSPTAKYMAINPNGYTGYSFSVTSANNSPTINNQHLVSGQNTTALANRMYTVVDAGTDNYPSGMTVRIYYDPADTTAAVAALDQSVSSPVTSQWFKISGSTHAANVGTILANQTAYGINGATFLVPSAKGVEGGINFVEFAGITSFSTFGYLAAKGTATLLPITLANFKATASGCMANLSWQSATEGNNSYYGIEESGDGSNFAQVAKVNSSNSASGAAYTHACTLQAGTNYFRLKMVDLDGKFSYSPTVAIVGTAACSTGIKATVSPNPTSNIVNITGLSIGSTTTLYDMNGKKTYTLYATATTATINMQSFAKGIYLLHIQKAGGTVETLKIVKQ